MSMRASDEICAASIRLGKIPALVLDDGSALFDSPVICEYLNNFGGGKFFPGMSICAARPAGAGRRSACRRWATALPMRRWPGAMN